MADADHKGKPEVLAPRFCQYDKHSADYLFHHVLDVNDLVQKSHNAVQQFYRHSLDF